MAAQNHQSLRSTLARRAVPAFIVAGLGFTSMAGIGSIVAPTIAYAGGAAEDEATSQGDFISCNGFTTDKDGNVVPSNPLRCQTLQEAFDMKTRFIVSNANQIKGSFTIPSWQNGMYKGITTLYLTPGAIVSGDVTGNPLFTVDGQLVVSGAEPITNENPSTQPILCGGMNDDGTYRTDLPVASVAYDSLLNLTDVDVYGTITVYGIAELGGGTYHGTITLEPSTDPTIPEGAIGLFDGDYRDLKIIDNTSTKNRVVARGGLFSINPKDFLCGSSVAKDNMDGTYTVYDFFDGANKGIITEGTYLLNSPRDGSSEWSRIPDDALAEGLVVEVQGTDSCVVKQSEYAADTVCTITNSDGTATEYNSLVDAAADTKSGDTIHLVRDIELDQGIELPQCITIDGNGRMITPSKDIAEDAIITIQGDRDPSVYPTVIKDLFIDGAGKAKSALNLVWCASEVNLDHVSTDRTTSSAVIVDSSNLAYSHSSLFADLDATGAIEFRYSVANHPYGGSMPSVLQATHNERLGNIAESFIPSSALADMATTLSEWYDTEFSTAETVAWFNNKDSAIQDLYYWANGDYASSDDPRQEFIETNTIIPECSSGGFLPDVYGGIGQYVFITPEPEEGYEVGSVTLTDASGNPIDIEEKIDGSWCFIMPAGDARLRVEFVESTPDPDPEPTPDPEPEPTPDPTPDPDPTPSEDEEVTVPETEGGSIEVEPVPAGDTATIVAEPEEGQEVRSIIVTNEQGNTVETSVDEEGNITFTMPEGGVTVEVVFGCDGGDLCETHRFSDIDQDQWYHDSVDWAVDNGIFNGYDNGTFGPDDPLYREQAAAVLYNYFGGSAGADESGMSDVESSQWYTDAVNWAVSNGIMTGYDGTSEFGVGDTLTREQFCAVIAKAMKVDTSNVDLSVLDAFTDADSISDWAKPVVAWAVQQGIVNGVENPDGTRSLQGTREIMRAEMAAMMKNAVDAGALAK